jgi:hypothetical protein
VVSPQVRPRACLTPARRQLPPCRATHGEGLGIASQLIHGPGEPSGGQRHRANEDHRQDEHPDHKGTTAGHDRLRNEASRCRRPHDQTILRRERHVDLLITGALAETDVMTHLTGHRLDDFRAIRVVIHDRRVGVRVCQYHAVDPNQREAKASRHRGIIGPDVMLRGICGQPYRRRTRCRLQVGLEFGRRGRRPPTIES